MLLGWRSWGLMGAMLATFTVFITFTKAGGARAESTSAQGSGGLSASASVMFKIVIPPVLGLRVDDAMPPVGTLRASVDPVSPAVRGARAGLALDIPGAGPGGSVLLRSNMRQVTVAQDNGPRTVVTVAAP